MTELPDPEWYLENVLINAEPGRYEPLQPWPIAQWRTLWRTRAESDGIVAVAARHGFVLGPTDLAEAGITRARVRAALRRGEWTAAGRGFVAPFALPGNSPSTARQRHALRAAAAALRRPTDVLSCRSAAVLIGLPTFDLPTVPELTVRRPTGLGVRRASHTFSASVSPDEIARWYGIEHTTCARTLVDLGRHDRRDAIMAADAALRERLVSMTEIAAATTRAAGWPGVRQARAVLALASPRAESALESLARMKLHDDGFPEPELQVDIGGYRVDMLFRRQRLILEIDGLAKYTDAESRREKRRERRLRARGYRVERLTWDDIVHRWAETRLWLRAAVGLPT